MPIFAGTKLRLAPKVGAAPRLRYDLSYTGYAIGIRDFSRMARDLRYPKVPAGTVHLSHFNGSTMRCGAGGSLN